MLTPNPIAIFIPLLNRTELSWMAVGSIASNAYGDFRTTNDIDLIVVLAPEQAEAVVAWFSNEEFYCPPLDVIREEAARSERGHFNLIHQKTSFKADMYIATRDPFQNWAMAHRREIDIGGVTVWLAPPEYVIIGKLEFYREGGSAKHLMDIKGMLAVTEVDLPLLEREVKKRGLTACWKECVN